MLAECCPSCNVGCLAVSAVSAFSGAAVSTAHSTDFACLQIPLMRDPANMLSQCVGCQRMFNQAELQVCTKQQHCRCSYRNQGSAQSQPHLQLR
jgi:hypothetical protein